MGIQANEQEILKNIENNLKSDWKLGRISKMDLSVLKLAIYEIKYTETPYKVAIIIVNMENEKQVEAGNHLYQTFKKSNIDVLLDDRKERTGVKFNDMDLIGIPIRITIGNKIDEHIVELKKRDSDEIKEISIFDVLYTVQDIIDEESI